MIKFQERSAEAIVAGTMSLIIIGLAVVGISACDDGARSDHPRISNGSPASAESRVAPEDPAEVPPAPVELVSTTREVALPEIPEPPRLVSWAEAESVFRTGDYAKSVELFETYTEREPENPWGYYMVGISAWRTGDLELAESSLRRTVMIDSTHTKALLNLARVLLERERPSDALTNVERVVALEPKSGEALRVLGNVYAELGAIENATAAYRDALVLDPEDAWSMNNLALIRIRKGRFNEALPPLARATELRPKVAVFQNNLGIVLERTGYRDEAASAFHAALETRPEYDKAATSLARVEARSREVPTDSIDLHGLASAFAEEVAEWKSARLVTKGEPRDTVKMTSEGG